jgi:hypothetical protein
MYRAMPSLAPWQRNVIALARGITLKASGKMKWTANVDVSGITPEDSTIYSLCPIEADREVDAATAAALSVGMALFGSKAQVGFVNQQNTPSVYAATVGEYQGAGVTQGRSLRILIREYHGVQ